jgi:uroporphyrinogen-III synthase
MHVLVTRPVAQALEWVAKLRAQKFSAHALPLIAIAPLPDATAVLAHWQKLQQMDLVVFVSPNAVAEFFALKLPHQIWPASTQVASSGPGTTQALQRCGVPTSSIIEPDPQAVQFDSETLWQVLGLRGRHAAGLPSSPCPPAPLSQTAQEAGIANLPLSWRGAQVLVVRGGHGRDWLANQLRDQGAAVQTLTAYQRLVPVLGAQQQQLLSDALALPASHVWFFSSSEAIANLAKLAPLAHWQLSTAVTTHPRIAQQANSLRMGRVHCVRPTLEAAVSCLQSLAL